jgi:hypothetical protein
VCVCVCVCLCVVKTAEYVVLISFGSSVVVAYVCMDVAFLFFLPTYRVFFYIYIYTLLLFVRGGGGFNLVEMA